MRFKKVKEYRIAVDPGIDFGWSRWHDGTLQEAHTISAPNHGVGPNEFWEAVHEQASILAECAKGCSRAMIEFPAFWDSVGGHTSGRSGALVKLSLVVGAYARAVEMVGCAAQFVEVNTWKGQLPKSVVAARIQKVLSPKEKQIPIKSHAVDAVGIGLWWHNRL